MLHIPLERVKHFWDVKQAKIQILPIEKVDSKHLSRIPR